jgi:hypothetical protein
MAINNTIAAVTSFERSVSVKTVVLFGGLQEGNLPVCISMECVASRRRLDGINASWNTTEHLEANLENKGAGRNWKHVTSSFLSAL